MTEPRCAECGKPPKYPFFGVYPLSKKGECKSCVNRRTMLRRWRTERELMNEYRLRAVKTLRPVLGEERVALLDEVLAAS